MLGIILNKKVNSLNMRGDHPNDFVLKVIGQEQYLVGNVPLINFMYIQEALFRDVVPTLVTVSVESVPGIIVTYK